MVFEDDDDDDDGWEDLPLPTANDEMDQEKPQSMLGLPAARALPKSRKNPEKQHHETTTRVVVPLASSSKPSSFQRSKKSIVSHPLEHIGTNFLWHAGCQLWKCDWHFRLSLAFLLVGAIFRCLLLSFYVYLYPRDSIVISTLVLAVTISGVLWNRQALEDLWKKLFQTDSFWKDRLQWIEDSMTSKQLRMIMALVMYGIPTIMEIETYRFLVSLVGLSVIAAVTFSAALAMAAKVHWCPMWLLSTGLYLLYATALCVALSQYNNLHHLPVLASRFCLATAVLLYQLSESSGSQVIQTALRLTVRDSLARVGSTVQQDELLQLTMLRWIVDYWSTEKSATTDDSNKSDDSRQETPEASMEWDELASMLQTTATQMKDEVQSLQKPEEAKVSPTETTMPTTPPEPHPLSLQTETQQKKSTRQESICRPLEHQSSSQNIYGEAFGSLQAMLSTMDIDESAKPTVGAYKNIVETFPPKQRSAIGLSVSRRLPATLLAFCWLVSGVGSWQGLILLAPFVALEMWRLSVWIRCCQEAAGEKVTGDVRDLQHVDPMVLLLVDPERSDSLLHVWRNIQSSVSTLEVGLTAAQAVQTTVIAADFCANMISLVTFGVEVSQQGWMHGVQTLVREASHLHATGTPIQALTHGVATPGTVTSAAVSAVRNSERLGRSLRDLSAKESAGPLVGSLVAAVPLVIGQGWLWGRESNARLSKRDGEEVSTVSIEELMEETEGSLLVEGERAAGSCHPDRKEDEFEAITVTEELAPSAISRDIMHSPAPIMKRLKEHQSEHNTDSKLTRAFSPMTGDDKARSATCKHFPEIDPCMAEEDSTSFEPLTELQLGDGATLTVDDAVDQGIVEEGERVEEENVWLKVGGGLAVVSAVIGAVAVTHRNISEGRRRGEAERR